jgi:hypothetical protein
MCLILWTLSILEGKESTHYGEYICLRLLMEMGQENQHYRPFTKHSLHQWRVSTSVSHCSTEDGDG